MASVSVMGTTSGSGSGNRRWRPTPSQVMLLEGIYRGGLNTPTLIQIQSITARLSLYGEVQGKNVFYWFQNHKARERQRLRKKLKAFYELHHPYPPHPQVGGVEDPLIYRTSVNNWQVDFPPDETSKAMCNCTVMTPPYFTRVVPETLQLFPLTTTTTDLKGDDPSSTTNP